MVDVIAKLQEAARKASEKADRLEKGEGAAEDAVGEEEEEAEVEAEAKAVTAAEADAAEDVDVDIEGEEASGAANGQPSGEAFLCSYT